ncbi:MAG: InlB B-repeat-containing protein [Butyrivibrio sp.]|nr:InlB B-repeat-containing protein [Butyrivibrio sp.]
MLKKWNRFLAFILAFALVITTFGSDFASAKAYADDGTEENTTVEAQEPAAEEPAAEEPAAEEPEVPEVVEDEPEVIPEVTPEVVPEVVPEVIPEEGDVPAETPEVVEPTEEEPAEDEEEVSDEDAEEAEEDEEASEEAEKNTVTVTYKYTKGGEIFPESETIDLDDPEAAFTGSTATAYENYDFIGWADAEGTIISTENPFVPEIKEDATYTATFEPVENIAELMPEIKVDSEQYGDFIVSLEAEVGVFPAGTTVQINQISDAQATQMAEAALGGEKQAKGIDISFVDADGNTIQPKNQKYVHVSLGLAPKASVEGDSFTVLHEHDGEVKEIDASVSTTDANSNPSDNTQVATEVTFDANKFSIFIVVADNQDSDETFELGTIRFYKDPKGTENNEVLIEKTVKNGDIISNPGIPFIGKNQEFIGWYVDGKKDGTKITFTNEEYVVDGITNGAEIDVYPVVSATYYVTFIGIDGEISHVEQVVVEKEGDEKLNLDGITVTPGAGQAFLGWAKEKDSTTTISTYDVVAEYEALPEGEEDLMLYAVVVPAYWVKFITNVGSEKGATYVGPQFLQKGQKVSEVLSKITTAPERTGYTLAGWSFSDAANREVDDLDVAVEEKADDKQEVCLYAVWAPVQNTKFTIIEWHESISSDEEDAWEYYSSKTCEGTTGKAITVTADATSTKVTVDGESSPVWSKLENKTNQETDETKYYKIGFEYNTELGSKYEISNPMAGTDSGINPAGDTVVNIYVSRKMITIKFVAGSTTEYEYVPGTGYNARYGLVNGQYIELEYDRWDGWGYYTGWWPMLEWHSYTGTRYEIKSSQQEVVYKTFTGKYGTTLKANGYTWPSEYNWYEEDGTRCTFLDAFLDNHTLKASNSSGGSYTINHYVMDTNGNYENSPRTSLKYSGGTFYFTDKYNGFSVAYYKGQGGSWTACHDPETNPKGAGVTSVSRAGNLSIRHERKQFDVIFKVIDPVTGNITEQKASNIYYEKKLSEVAAVNTIRNASTDPKENYKNYKKAGYSFEWYKNPQGGEGNEFDFDTRMPDGGIVIYGVYTPVKFTVTLHLEGGTIIDSHLAPQFNVESTEEVDRNTLINGVAKENYRLLGWYYKDGDVLKEFKYGRITDNIDLYAQWIYAGTVKIAYKGGDRSDSEFIPDYNYAPGTTAVVAAPPSNIDDEDEENHKYYTFVGWKVTGGDGAVLLPNDAFKLTNEVIEAGYDEGGVRYVEVVAQYKETGTKPGKDELTTLIYDPNGGEPKSGVTEDFNENDQVVIENLKVNYKVIAKDALYTKPGYRQKSWNTMPDGSGLTVEFGTEHIAADNLDRDKNLKRNTLYAIYEQVKLYAVIAAADPVEVAYDGNPHENCDFTVERAYYIQDGEEVEVDTDEAKNAIKFLDGFTGAKGTDVKRDASDNVIAYTKSITADDFELTENSGYTDVDITVDTDKDELELTITPVKVTVTITGTQVTAEYDGKKHAAENYKVDDISVTSYTENDFTFSGTAKAERTDVVETIDGEEDTDGQTDMGLTKDNFTNNNKNFDVTFAVTDGFVKITPVEDEVTVKITGDWNVTTYDKTEHKVTGYDVEISNKLYKEADFTFTPSEDVELENKKPVAKRTDVGQTDMKLDKTQFTNNNTNFTNVTFEVVDGYQKINPVDKITVTITGKQVTEDYDSKKHTAEGYDVEISDSRYTEDDFKFNGTAKAERTDVVETIDGTEDTDGQTDMGLKDSMFENKDKNFDVEFVIKEDGFVKINPLKVTVTITGTKDEVEYDGKIHAVDGYKTEISDKLYKESDYTVTAGSDTEKAHAEGKKIDTYPMNLSEKDFENNNKNFDVTFDVTDGELKIKGRSQKFEITATPDAVDSMVYSGLDHKGDTFTYTLTGKGADPVPLQGFVGTLRDLFGAIVANAAEGVPVEIDGATFYVTGLKAEVLEASARDVGTYTIHIVEEEGGVKISDGESDVTDQFTVKHDDTTPLKITKKDVTVKTGSASAVYSAGKKLSNPEASLDGIVDSDKDHVSVKAISVLDKAATIPNKYELSYDEAFNPDNYNWIDDLGELKMTNPTPGPNPPTPGPTPTPTPDAPPATPVAQVLGARREEPAAEAPAVLGARRGRTADDTATGTARLFAIIVSAAVAMALLFKGKKKEED